MAQQLKDIFFTQSSIKHMASTIKRYYPSFDEGTFVNLVFDKEWTSKELKEKMRHTTVCLKKTLPPSYADALDILYQCAPHISGFDGMTLPDFVELYGQDDWDLSLSALRHFTRFSSSEFAIRPFLLQNAKAAMAFMSDCAEDENEDIRRFASEGCRPRLPWAMALPAFKKDPAPIFAVLEKIKDDDSEYVRKSVANNLNDISKDHPDLVLNVCEQWHGISTKTDWIIKHACRSLLKAGNPRAMKLFRYCDPELIDVTDFTLNHNRLAIGNKQAFSFTLVCNSNTDVEVRIEYAVGYLKLNQKRSQKVFKLTEKSYSPGQHPFTKDHSFADLSTRKHHPGEHTIAIIINGKEKAKLSFQLVE